MRSRTAFQAPLSPTINAHHRAADAIVVNDIHSRLNATEMARIEAPTSVRALQRAMRHAAREGRPVAIAGGRHAMGSQQFGTGAVLLDMRGLDQVLAFDAVRGLVEVQAGIQWPALIAELRRRQEGSPAPWAIAQKQTGADRLSIGGAIAANIHGRGLTMRPFIADIESLTLLGPDGESRLVSRTAHPDLFRLVVGGYGLFGVVTSATLRLVPRRTLRRVVEVITVDTLMEAFAQRISAGFLYGDFQFAIDPASDDFLHRGVFSTYQPVDPATPIPPVQRALAAGDWQRLLHLAHTRKSDAFDAYARHYLATSGQLYHSDLHQLADYLDDYHPALDRAMGAVHPGSEMITEIYVPRHRLTDFLAETREDFRREAVDLVYGTVRLVERDDESALSWARESWACTIFNLHVDHTAAAIARSGEHFRRLIDMAVRRGGSYYLTYHRHATREQVLACHPRLPGLLSAKQAYDPAERIQSDWYRHYRDMLLR
ncbi:MAG TPA: FAD-binding oxidoreductase [Gemmatimonadaceae bacterium]|nr:FAD-binding oxidoreductase [Gemmatimonadaceae bacterium]